MNSKKLYLSLLATMFVLGAASIAGVYYGDKMLHASSKKLYDLKAESLKLSEQQTTLVKAKDDIERYKEIESIARTVVPQEKDQARTVRELIAIGNRTGVKISNISFSSSTLGTVDKKKKTTEDSNATQLTPVEGIAGVSEMEINLQTDNTTYIPFTTLLTFLKELEQNRRTSQVKSLTVTPLANNRERVTFSAVLSVYIDQEVKKK